MLLHIQTQHLPIVARPSRAYASSRPASLTRAVRRRCTSARPTRSHTRRRCTPPHVVHRRGGDWISPPSPTRAPSTAPHPSLSHPPSHPRAPGAVVLSYVLQLMRPCAYCVAHQPTPLRGPPLRTALRNPHPPHPCTHCVAHRPTPRRAAHPRALRCAVPFRCSPVRTALRDPIPACECAGTRAHACPRRHGGPTQCPVSRAA